MSEPPHICTWHERATKFSDESVWKCQGLLLPAHLTGRVRGQPNSVLNQIWTNFESDLNQFWIRSEPVLNQIRISFDSDLKCTTFLSQSTVNNREMASRFLGNTSMASNPGPKESNSGKRGSNWPLIQVFPKMNVTFSWSSRPSKAPKDLMHLARNPKMASNYIP